MFYYKIFVELNKHNFEAHPIRTRVLGIMFSILYAFGFLLAMTLSLLLLPIKIIKSLIHRIKIIGNY